MLSGIYAATLTPVSDGLDPDAERAVPYYRRLLERGCDGINILGTTGEAMSFSAEQRIAFMTAIAGALPRECVTCGTGAASLADAVRLTQQAFDLGFAAALVMPPFFYRDAGDDGVVAFFDRLLSRTQSSSRRVLLYNFPRMSGITFGAGLVERLANAFSHVVVGMKDSSNDRALQRDVLKRLPEFKVFPGSEHYLAEARAYGAAGCISGSVALWPKLAREVFRDGDAAKSSELARRRASLDGRRLIEAVRDIVAEDEGDLGWRRSVPPLVNGA